MKEGKSKARFIVSESGEIHAHERSPAELQQELSSMDEKKILDKIDHLMLSLDVFKGNYHELNSALKAYENPELTSQLWAIENRHKLIAFQKMNVTRPFPEKSILNYGHNDPIGDLS